MRRAALGMVLVAAGCTAANPFRAADDFGANGDLSASPPDLAAMPSSDLAGSDLAVNPGSDLAGADLAGADLAVDPGSDLADSDLSASDLATNDLSSVDLRGADMAIACATPPQGPLTSYFAPPGAFAATIGAGSPLEIVIPDGHRVHGTVAVGSSLPTVLATDGGAPAVSFELGRVTLRNRATGETAAARNLTPVAANSFSYEAFLPVGAYDITAQFQARVEDPENPLFPARVLVVGSAADVIVCGDTTRNLSLPSVPTLTPKRVRVSGRNSLSPAPNGLMVLLETPSGAITFAKSASRYDDLVFFDVFGIDNLPLPEGATLLATVRPFRGTEPNVPRAGGIDSRMRLQSNLVVGTGAEAFGALAIPPSVTISGTVTNSFNQLFPAGPDAQHGINCTRDPDTRVNENSFGGLFTDAPNYALHVRSGVECHVTAAFLVGMPSPGMTQTNTRENTDGVLFLPKAAANETIAADLTRNYSIPNLGTQIQVALRLKDVRGATLAAHQVTLESTALTDSSLGDARLRVGVISDGAGTANAHLLPGSYDLLVTRP